MWATTKKNPFLFEKPLVVVRIDFMDRLLGRRGCWARGTSLTWLHHFFNLWSLAHCMPTQWIQTALVQKSHWLLIFVYFSANGQITTVFSGQIRKLYRCRGSLGLCRMFLRGIPISGGGPPGGPRISFGGGPLIGGPLPCIGGPLGGPLLLNKRFSKTYK